MERQIREAYEKVLEISKNYLEAVDADTLFFVDDVLVTSAEHVMGMEALKVMYQKAKDLVLVTVSEISRLQEEVLMETDRNKTTSSDDEG